MPDEFYKSLIDASPIGYACHDIQYDESGKVKACVFTYLNQAFGMSTGLDIKASIGKTIRDVMYSKNLKAFLKWINYIDNLILGCVDEEVEWCFKGRWYRCKIHLPKKDHVITQLTDITNEHLLRLEKERYALSIEGSNDGIWDWDITNSQVFLSPRWKVQVGYKDFEIENKIGSFESLIHPEDKDRVLRYRDEYLAGKTREYDITLRMVHKDQSIRWIRSRGEALRDIEGKPYRMAGSHTDITDQINERASRLGALNKFHKLFSNNPALMAVLDTETLQFREVNEAFSNKLGYEKEEVINKTPDDISLYVNDDDQLGIIKLLIQEGRVANEELRFKNKQGEEITGLIFCELIENKLEKSLLAVMVDMTEQKNIENQLRVRDRLISAVAESIQVLLKNTEYLSSVKTCFELLGRATQVDGVYLYKNSYDESGNGTTSRVIEWDSENGSKLVNKEIQQHIPFNRFEYFFGPLKQNRPVYWKAKDFDEGLREKLEKQNVLSIIVLPIFISDSFWGFLEVAECKYEREWTGIEISTLAAFNSSLEKTIERQMMEENLKVAKQRAESANISKSQFLANMSHEIRTPINGVIGMLSLLDYGELSEEQICYVKEAKKASKILLYLINDILDISKIEAGKLTLEQAVFDLRLSIKETVSIFKPKADFKHIKLKLDIEPEVPKKVVGDWARLRQIINNLLSNAIKFTHEGSISVGVKVERVISGDEIEIQFNILDTGIGMEEDVVERIFNPFEQGDTSTTRNYGGTGLGLAISKELVEMMGGNFYITSRKDVGSTFTFTVIFGQVNEDRMPLEEYTNNKQLPATVGAKKGNIKREQLKILLVEDNKINQMVAIKVLENEGYVCDLACNGKEAIEAYQKEDYDIVFMDCQMPIMDGYEASEKIRDLEGSNKYTYIVAMTAYAMEGDEVKCYEAGMDDYLTKPIDFKHVIYLLESYGEK